MLLGVHWSNHWWVCDFFQAIAFSAGKSTFGHQQWLLIGAALSSICSREAQLPFGSLLCILVRKIRIRIMFVSTIAVYICIYSMYYNVILYTCVRLCKDMWRKGANLTWEQWCLQDDRVVSYCIILEIVAVWNTTPELWCLCQLMHRLQRQRSFAGLWIRRQDSEFRSCRNKTWNHRIVVLCWWIQS